MKKHVVIICYLSLLFLSPWKTIAQPPAGDGPMGPPPEIILNPESSRETAICQLQMDWLRKKLRLDKTQFTAVEKITAVFVKKVLALKKTITDAPSLKAATDQADLERDQAMKPVLSVKQFTRYIKNKQVLENSFEYGNYGGMPPPPGQ